MALEIALKCIGVLTISNTEVAQNNKTQISVWNTAISSSNPYEIYTENVLMPWGMTHVQICYMDSNKVRLTLYIAPPDSYNQYSIE